MKGSKIITVIAAASCVLALAACSKKTPAMASATGYANGPNLAQDNNSVAAKAYAMNNPKGYQGQIQRKANGELINRMSAPANQTYYFAFDSNKVAGGNFAALNVQANYLASHPNAKVRLEGNTDNRGSREYNIGLGWRRDQSVTRLLEQQGVRPNQIDMVSYGKERPVVMGDNSRAWQLNRRVNLVYEAY